MVNSEIIYEFNGFSKGSKYKIVSSGPELRRVSVIAERRPNIKDSFLKTSVYGELCYHEKPLENIALRPFSIRIETKDPSSNKTNYIYIDGVYADEYGRFVAHSMSKSWKEYVS